MFNLCSEMKSLSKIKSSGFIYCFEEKRKIPTFFLLPEGVNRAANLLKPLRIEETEEKLLEVRRVFCRQQLGPTKSKEGPCKSLVKKENFKVINQSISQTKAVFSSLDETQFPFW